MDICSLYPLKDIASKDQYLAFFSCGLLLLDEVGGSLGKDSAVAHGVIPAQWMPQGRWAEVSPSSPRAEAMLGCPPS